MILKYPGNHPYYVCLKFQSFMELICSQLEAVQDFYINHEPSLNFSFRKVSSLEISDLIKESDVETFLSNNSVQGDCQRKISDTDLVGKDQACHQQHSDLVMCYRSALSIDIRKKMTALRSYRYAFRAGFCEIISTTLAEVSQPTETVFLFPPFSICFGVGNRFSDLSYC